MFDFNNRPSKTRFNQNPPIENMVLFLALKVSLVTVRELDDLE